MSFVPGKIDSLWDKVVVPRILEQYKYAENWKFCLKCVVDGLQKVENGSFAIARYFRVPTSFDEMSSENLEYVAALVNVFRKEGESDQQLFERFVLRNSSTNSGTPDRIIKNVSMLSGDASPLLLEDSNARFLVYTHGFKQIANRTVQSMAVAGVIGISAARFKAGNGKCFMIPTADGYKNLLCVANDKTIRAPRKIKRTAIKTEEGLFLLTEDGKVLTTEE